MYSENGLIKLENHEIEFLDNENFDQEKRYYVYVYLDLTEEKIYSTDYYAFGYRPIYVGKGCGKRMYAHLSQAIESTKMSYKLNKIRKLIREGIEPLIGRITELIREEEAYFIENCLLNDLKMYNVLTNIREGFTGYKFVNREQFSKLITEANLKSYTKDPDRARRHSIKVSGSGNGHYGKGYLCAGERNGNYVKIDSVKLVELYSLGFSCKQIAKIFKNISGMVVKSRLKLFNIPRKIGRHSNKRDSTNRDSLIDNYIKGGITYEEFIRKRKEQLNSK